MCRWDVAVPGVPVRQLVLSTPFEIRFLLARRVDSFNRLMKLFEEELAEAFENIKTVPALGSPTAMTSRGKLVRRMEMRKTQYQVY
jgi:hypothetical protein